MILVILTETALFTIFVVAYLFYIGKSMSGPYPHEVLELPILGTVLLLSSSATIVVAERNLHKGVTSLFNLWWVITALLGVGFLIYTAVEWHKLIYDDHLTISTNLFGSTFYSLVGSARQSRRDRLNPDPVDPDFKLNRVRQRLSSRAYHYDLLVLAFRRRGMGGRLHGGLRHRCQFVIL